LEQLEAYLLLSCNGLKEKNGFIHCSGVSNHFLDLSEVEKEKYRKLLDFLENACDLFERPMYKYNKCLNAINFLHREFEVIDKETLLQLHKFLKTHKECGTFIMLVLKEDYDE